MSSISAEGWVLIITAAAAGIGGLYAAFLKGRKDRRADAIDEWKEYAGDLKKQIGDQGTEIRALTAQVFSLHDAHATAIARGSACEARAAALEGEIKLLQTTVQRLQGLAGDDAPAVQSPGVIVAGVDGMIKQVSPSVTPLLHWMAKDLLGKNVELLIPERFLEKHRAGMKALASGGSPPWTEKVILGYANMKDGGEVAVAITLAAWQDRGAWLISAEVKKRSATTLVMDK